MNEWHFDSMSIAYFSSSGISLVLCYIGWKFRVVRGARLFFYMVFFVSIWVIAYTLEIYSQSQEFKIQMLKFEYLGMAGAAYFWVFFVAKYINFERWVTPGLYIAVAIIPLFILYNIVQAPYNTVVHKSFDTHVINGLIVFENNRNWGFYIWAAYAYSMILAGVFMLMLRFDNLGGPIKKQLMVLVPVAIIILTVNLFFVLGKHVIYPYDPTPISMVLVGIMLLYSIYFNKFLNVIPIAYDRVLKNIKAGVILLDKRAHIIEVNTVAESILGKREKFLLNNHIHKVLPECKDVVKDYPIGSDLCTEMTLSDSKKTYELKVNPLSDGSQDSYGQIIMMWDITVQKMAFEELDAYARTVAHDLKSPLSQIIGSARIIDNKLCQGEQYDEFLQNIISTGEKMANIVDSLLILAHIRNVDKVEVEQVDMKSVVNTVIERLQPTIVSSGTSLKVGEEWVDTQGNALWLEEVWVNLISNAIKYGGNPPEVEVGCTRLTNSVKYWVKDNGQGLNSEEQRYLFTEFTRSHPDREKIKGHGLGLSIVQRILRKLNGKIGVESEIGKGSEFYFILPLNTQ